MIISNLEHSDLFSLSNLRLFSSGGGSELLEWDLVSGCVLVRFLFILDTRDSSEHIGREL